MRVARFEARFDGSLVLLPRPVRHIESLSLSRPRDVLAIPHLRLVARAGESACLSSNRWPMFVALFGQPHRSLEAADLIEAVWPDPSAEPEWAVRSLWVQLHRLRHNLAPLRLSIGSPRYRLYCAATLPRDAFVLREAA